jgi:hypothetical protein
MHRILFLLDIRPAGYPVRARYWISSRISVKGQILNIQPDIQQVIWYPAGYQI